jgi:hypothetical protein
MRRFENLTYMFVGVAIGFLLVATTHKEKVVKEYCVVEIPKTSDISDKIVDSERGYYEHLINTK